MDVLLTGVCWRDGHREATDVGAKDSLISKLEVGENESPRSSSRQGKGLDVWVVLECLLMPDCPVSRHGMTNLPDSVLVDCSSDFVKVLPGLGSLLVQLDQLAQGVATGKG